MVHVMQYIHNNIIYILYSMHTGSNVREMYNYVHNTLCVVCMTLLVIYMYVQNICIQTAYLCIQLYRSACINRVLYSFYNT